jgi:hypothetical protein
MIKKGVPVTPFFPLYETKEGILLSQNKKRIPFQKV